MKDLVKLQPELKKKTLTTKQLKLNNFSLGTKGEKIACDYLLSQKYKIIAQNIRVKNNEIDIIALDTLQNELVFIEVKTRSSFLFGTPAFAVSNKKLNSMAFVANHYLQQNNCNLDYRFDIIAISYFGKNSYINNCKCSKTANLHSAKPKIEHFENISWP